MIKVSSLKDLGIFSEDFLRELPTECSICGGSLEMTEMITKIVCVNKDCKSVGLNRLKNLLNVMGLKDIDDVKCLSILEKHNTNSPYILFLYDVKKGVNLYDGCSKEDLSRILKRVNGMRSMYLWEYVKIGGIDIVSDYAKILFAGYEDINSFYDDLEEQDESLLNKLIGVVDGEVVNVKTVLLYKKLKEYEVELKESIKGVKIKPNGLPELVLCIGAKVGEPYKKRLDFIKDIKTMLKDDYSVNIVDYITKDCNYYICENNGYETSKTKKAREYNIPILTGLEFKEDIKKEVLSNEDKYSDEGSYDS